MWVGGGFGCTTGSESKAVRFDVTHGSAPHLCQSITRLDSFQTHPTPHVPAPEPLCEVLQGHEPPVGGPRQQADLDHLFGCGGRAIDGVKMDRSSDCVRCGPPTTRATTTRQVYREGRKEEASKRGTKLRTHLHGELVVEVADPQHLRPEALVRRQGVHACVGCRSRSVCDLLYNAVRVKAPPRIEEVP